MPARRRQDPEHIIDDIATSLDHVGRIDEQNIVLVQLGEFVVVENDLKVLLTADPFVIAAF